MSKSNKILHTQLVTAGRKGCNKITVSHPFFPPHQSIAKFKIHTTSLGSDQEFKVGGCLNQKITSIYFVKKQDFINLRNGIMISVALELPNQKTKAVSAF